MGVAISGLSSGMDTGALIQNLMRLEKIPYTNLETKKSTVTNNKSIFNSINLKLKNLRDAATSLTDLGSFQTSSAKSSDVNKLTVTGGDTSLVGNYTVNVIQLAKQQVNATTGIQVKDSENNGIAFTAEDLAAAKGISIGGKTLTGLDDLDLTSKTKEEALAAVAVQISKQFDNVQASLVQTDERSKTLVVTAKKSGEEIAVSGTGIFDFGSAPKVEAQRAKLVVNNIEISSASNTVTDAIPGTTLQLLTENTTVNVEVKQDTDKIADKVQTFVTAYNDVVKLIRENTKKIENEKNADGSYKDFKTNLQSDSLLKQLRNELYDIVSSVTSSNDQLRILSDIGLEIDKGKSIGSEMTGELSFDKKVFVQKLNEDAGAVEQLFKNEYGLGTLAKDRLFSWTKTDGLMSFKLSGLQTDIDFISEQMENMSVRLALKEEALNKQFTQMEVALGSLKNQQSWLSGQLNALMSS